jgi:hypothetical protein
MTMTEPIVNLARDIVSTCLTKDIMVYSAHIDVDELVIDVEGKDGSDTYSWQLDWSKPNYGIEKVER